MHVLSEWKRDNEKLGYLETGEKNLDWELAAVHSVAEQEAASNVDSASQSAKRESSPAVQKFELNFNSGSPKHSFTELSGLPGTGKTAVYLSVALDTLSRGLSVSHISCNYSKFPVERAHKLEGWKPERYDKRVHELFVDSIDKLVLLDVDWSAYAFVIVEQYDASIKQFWTRDEQQRAYSTISGKLVSSRDHSCVSATCGCERHRNLDNTLIVAPKSVLIPKPITGAVRLMLYKKPNGDSVLSTGLAFRPALTGLVSLSPSDQYDYEVPLSFSSTKKRATPSRNAAMMTPHSKSHSTKHRRDSVSTPVRNSLDSQSSSSCSDSSTKRIRTMTPASSESQLSSHDSRFSNETASSATYAVPNATYSVANSTCSAPRASYAMEDMPRSSPPQSPVKETGVDLNKSNPQSDARVESQQSHKEPSNLPVAVDMHGGPYIPADDALPLPGSFIPSSPEQSVDRSCDVMTAKPSHPPETPAQLPQWDTHPSQFRVAALASRSRSMQIIEDEAVQYIPNSQNES